MRYCSGETGEEPGQMSRLPNLFAAAIAALLMASPGMAQPLTALARVDGAASTLRDAGGGIEMRLALGQPVPYRLRLLDGPPRLVADFSEVAWDGLSPDRFDLSKRVTGLRMGSLRPGWSRLVLDLDAPYRVASAEMRRDKGTGRGELALRLEPVSADALAAAVAAQPADSTARPKAADLPPPRRRNDGSYPLRVVLDPGHGGIDPGAERGGVVEADLMLTFARELREVLIRAGFEVILTRDSDEFVPLQSRATIARDVGADLFLSLHADVVAEGIATGATVYTLSETATDAASRSLAESHDRADLLAGVDLAGHDDVIAGVLMDLARVETAPRAQALAQHLVKGLEVGTGGHMHKHPLQSAGFSVLKAPDIPSVLIELGFMSSKRDLKNLTDPAWRLRAAAGIRDAVLSWSRSDAAQLRLLRQ